MFLKRVIAAGMALLLLTQGLWAAFAQEPTLQAYRFVYGEHNADGSLIPTYIVDEDGNRVDPPAVQTVNAAAESLPAKYDLRSENCVTSIKNQSGAWNCWAFASLASMEISYVRQGFGTAANTDFSEAHLVWFGHRSRVDDLSDPTHGDGTFFQNPFLNGGSWEEAAATVMRGSGLQLESNAKWINSYDSNVLMQMAQPESDRYASYARLMKVGLIQKDQTSVDNIKRHVMSDGGVVVYYYDDTSVEKTAFNATYHSYYQNKHSGESNHAVTIIGWDDTFARTKFNTRPTQNGAWLVKGSWSEGYGDSGYCWISFEDPSIMCPASFVTAPGDIYDNIYQYDGAYPTWGIQPTGSASEANLFTAKKAERLTHVGVFSPNEQWMQITVRVYVDEGNFSLKNNNPTNGMKLVNEATTTIDDMEYGYRTIPLKNPVLLQAGQKFVVEAEFKEPSGGTFFLPMEGFSVANPAEKQMSYGGSPGESFVHALGVWNDTNRLTITGDANGVDYNNVPLKAMTQDLDVYEPQLRVASAPAKTEYYLGDTLDTTGLSLLYTNRKGKESTVRSGFTCTPSALQTVGAQEITVSYQGLQTTFYVQVHPVSLAITDQDLRLRTGQTRQLTLQKQPASLNVQWSTSNPAVVSVSTTGQLHALAEGSAEIRATAAYGAKQYGASCTVRVEDPPVRALRTNIAQTLYEGDSLKIPSIDVVYTDGTMTTITQGFDYAPKTLQTAGTQTVTLTFGKWSDTLQVQVQPLTLTLYPQSLSLTAGQTASLTAQTQPSGLKVRWTSSKPSVASVSDAGMVRAAAAGDAVIRAEITNGSKTCSAVCAVHVAPVPTLRIRKPSVTTLKYGQSLTLHAETANLPAGARILWTEGSDLVNRPGQNNDAYTVKAEKSGTVHVTAYLVDNSGNLIRNSSGDAITARQDITMRCGLFEKIGAFFRRLFGVRTHFPDVFFS